MMFLRTALVLALAAILALALAACGGDDSVSQEELEQAKEEAVQEAETEADLDKLREQVRKLKKEGGSEEGGSGGASAGGDTGTSGGGGAIPAAPGAIPDDALDCGEGVYAEAGTTSCAFALNVANDWLAFPSTTVESFSPTTEQSYTMACSEYDPVASAVLCTGGENAAVYIAVDLD